MISRKLDNEIREHYETSKNALLLTGARQTGKTYAIRKYSKSSQLNLIEINFFEDKNAAQLLDGVQNAKELLLRISAYTKKNISGGKTLIFFDEVQECPDIITWVKFLVEEGSCKIALSGSMLGVELKDIRSIPVGYMSVINVYPLDFEDFARAVGLSDAIIEHLQECFLKKTKVDDVVHESLLKLIRLYLIIGGMPAAVQAYIDTNDLNVVEAKQHEILTMYRWDISRYDKVNKLSIGEIFDLIPSELNAKNKRFILKNLNENARYKKYAEAFLWLKDAGVAIPTYNVCEPVIPLVINEQRNLFKLFLNDVGLLASLYASGIQFKILNNEVNINYGAIYENLVAQELTAHGYGNTGHNLYYFNDKKLGELDFVIEQDGEIIPIEVKSGKDYERHNALKNVVAEKNYHISQAYIFSNANLSVKGNFTYMPVYMLMFMKRTKPANMIYKIDFL